MARQVQVNYQEKPCYKIILNHSFDGFLDALEQEGIARDRKICIVTDTNVAKLYLNEVTEICKMHFQSSNTLYLMLANPLKTWLQ